MKKRFKQSYRPEIHHRRSIRMKGYDYSKSGLYFITLCTHNRAYLFGDIITNQIPEMKLSDGGKIVEECWQAIPQHFPNVVLHAFVVMPNHIHGIVEIIENETVLPDVTVGANNYSPLRSPSKTIGSIIRGYKIGVTKWFRQNTCIKNVWHRNYYEIIIRDAKSYQNITRYIFNNPANWKPDKFHVNLLP